MPFLAILFGAALIALGVTAYLSPDLLGVGKDGLPPKPGQPTALSPVVFGGILVLSGLISLAKPGARKHAMHAAAVAGLLGTLGGFVPAVLRGFNFAETAVKVGVGMAGLSAVFLVLCVNSFIQARKRRKAAGA